MKPLVFSLLVLLGPATAQARELFWSSFDVTARLDAEGVLHVSERQAIVFDGAWNGGERIFVTRPGERLRLGRVARIDPGSGETLELERGDLDQVDEWDWESRNVLRWRSRLRSDPPFDAETIIYQLDYTLRGVIRDEADGYRLDHEFGFTDREGVIEVFTLELEVDPAWIAPELPGSLRLEDLQPGQAVVVTGSLDRAGTGTPAAIDRAVGDHKVYALALAVLCLLGLKLQGLWRAETAQGRRERPAVADPVSREWLESEIFSLRPEEAGALWDRKVGPPEVAAVIARLVAEGKLESRVTDDARWWSKPTMELELLTDRAELVGYERALIDKLFFDDRTKTDTAALRKHYSSSGFEPASAIRPGLESRLELLAGDGEEPAKPSWKPTALLFLAWLAAVVLEVATRGMAARDPLLAAFALVGPLPVIWAYIAAGLYQRRLGRPPRAWMWFLIPLGLLTAGCFIMAWGGSGGREILEDLRPGIFGVLAFAIFPLVVANSVLNTARTRERRGLVARRQLLAAGRRHLAKELESPTPNLEDDWFPYILAFGLSEQADAWARSFGGDGATANRVGTSSWSSSSTAGSSWSGGGGAFGGAGATAAWTAAATGMAAGVSAPSSSGGSSGGGGGSSGGGGGGGW